MTHRVHLPGQLLTFRWPVPSPSFLADSAFRLSLHALHASLPQPSCQNSMGGGSAFVSSELWSGLLQTDPSWADLECWSFSCLPSHCLPTLQRSPLLSAVPTGPWRLVGKGSMCVQVCVFARVHVGMCILEGPCGHNLICWCRGAGGDTDVGGFWGRGQRCHGAQGVAGVFTPVW